MYKIEDEKGNIIFETDDIDKFWKRYYFLYQTQVEARLDKSIKILDEVIEEKFK